MRRFAVFDIDGTLIRWQLYHTMVDRIAKNHLSNEQQQKVKDARMLWKRRVSDEAFKQYEQVLVGVFEEALLSINPSEFDDLIHEVVEEYKEQTYTYTRRLVEDLKRQNYVLLAISGSHQELVAEIAKFYGFDDFAGTRYERKNGKYSGEKYIASFHKKEILEVFIKKHQLTLESSIAVGDSESDIPMLELVEQPIVFNPNKGLLNVAKAKGWKVVVERKNVVYELEAKGGTYVLA